MNENENKYKRIPSSSFPNICRTCLLYTELFLIDEVCWEGLSLEELIQNWTPLEIKENDEMPRNMCKSCIKHMYQTYHFLFKCKKSEAFLYSILESERSAENETAHIGKGDNNLESLENDSANKNQGDNDNRSDVYSDHNENENDDPIETAVESNGPCKIENTEDFNVKCDIKKDIQVKHKVKMRKMAKAKLVAYNDLPKGNKRPYVFRKGPPYTCITCDASFQCYDDLKKHKIETKHKKALKFICPFCQRRHDAYSKYLEHVRTHTGEKPNKCPTCGKYFNFKTDLKRHMIMHMDVKPYICRFCNKGFTRRQYLTDHERKHTGEQLLCLFCGRGFHSYSTLSYHEKTHKGPPGCVRDPMSKDKLFQCQICDKVLLTEQTLKAHTLLHGPRNFSCEICGKTYISKNRLQDHIRFSHQETKYSCNICNKEYKQKSGLEVHIKSHYGQNNYPCEICGKHFACKGSLYQHKRVHTKDTKYQCKECLHICINKRHLENHMRTHTGEKPFACVFCGKTFAQKANMQAHTKIHTGEKNHVCKICSKAFYDGRGLKKHMAVHDKNGELEPFV
ncbi:hypothetical protein GWI33_015045 [Rhynchophorus ferrugineus]|uniref:Uncharacterized protein n=1 Tax=Rhynchophorus ferrugineus TaxID=354439 RepID=A0A834I0H9_RHYFE|nr:hypothetical protein GWI33_015045 [Rhynchophorus ferrugineus]